jgi:hypothetical protein
MTAVSVFGVLLGLLAIPAFFRHATFSRLALAVGIVALHIAAAQVYYYYTLTSYTDANGYYYLTSFWHHQPWTALGSPVVGHIAQALRANLGASYIDCFMVFQAFGTWGIMILMRTFQEIHEKVQTRDTNLPLYLLFIPSLHFWTSAIGKDAPIFMAAALCTWSVMNLSKRWVQFGISIGIMVLFRVHIALAAAIAIMVASLVHGQFSMGRKAALAVLSVIAGIMLLSAVQATFGVDLTDPNSLMQFMADRSAAEFQDKASTSIASSGFAIRLLSLLFRPLFFDAKNAFALIASVENVGSVLLFTYLLTHFRDIRQMSKQVLFVRFVLFFSLILIALLAAFDYNVGLGLRERATIMPSLFCLFVAVYAFRHRVAAPAPAKAAARPVALPTRPATQLPTA